MARARVERSPDDRPVLTSRSPGTVTTPVDATTVLDLVECLLRERGWCQGRARGRSGRLSLDGAVAEAADTLGRSDRERLVLAARTRNHLTRCAGAGALGAWNDRPERNLDEITELIAIARFLGV